MTKEIKHCLLGFESITLKALDNFKLINRVDTKYIFNRTQLIEILDRVKHDYKVLEINNQRLFNYETMEIQFIIFCFHYYDWYVVR